MNNRNYGVFVYRNVTDENIYNEYYCHSSIAIKNAKFLKKQYGHSYYVEVWKKDKDGLWGNTGEPLFKSDNMKQEIKVGTRFYLIDEYGKFLRTIKWKNEYFFEWNNGWHMVSKLEPNPDIKSKVKLILNTNE